MNDHLTAAGSFTIQSVAGRGYGKNASVRVAGKWVAAGNATASRSGHACQNSASAGERYCQGAFSAPDRFRGICSAVTEAADRSAQ
jgi:hypothetical protein